MFPESLELSASAREAAEPCEACCFDSRRKQFLVIDKRAMRLFSACKQIRSFHFSKDHSSKAVAAYMIADLDIYVVVFAGNQNPTHLQLWTCTLQKICKIVLPHVQSHVVSGTANASVTELTLAGSDAINVYRLSHSKPFAPNESLSKLRLSKPENFCVNHVGTAHGTFQMSGGIHYLLDGMSLIILCKRSVALMLRTENSNNSSEGGETTTFKVHMIEHLWSESVSPTALLQCSDHIVLIGFSDGSLRAFLCRAPDTSEGTFQMIYEYRHDLVQPSTAILCLHAAVWGNTNDTVFEFFASSTRSVMHWCLDLGGLEISLATSLTANFRDKSAPEIFQLNGIYDYEKHFGSWMLRSSSPQLVAFEIIDDFGFWRKRLFFSCGGVVGFLCVHESCHEVLKSCDEIRSSCCDDECRTLFVATDSSVGVYKGSTLSRLFHVSGIFEESDKIYFSALHWSSDLEHIFVGTTDGNAAGIVIMSGAGCQWSQNVKTVHNCKVTAITSFLLPRKRQVSSKTIHSDSARNLHDKRECAVVICDECGTISVWRTVTVDLPQAKTRALKLCYTSKGHMGAIFYAQECVIAGLSGFTILVTACSQGYVKCWTSAANGSLQLCAYFKAQILLSSFYCSQLPSTMVNESRIQTMTGIQIICVCGTVSGCIQIWMLSDGSQTDASGPLFSLRLGSSAIVSIKEDHRSIQSDGESLLHLMCAMSDGYVASVSISSDRGEPLIREKRLTSFPLQIKAIFAKSSTIFVCSDTKVLVAGDMSSLAQSLEEESEAMEEQVYLSSSVATDASPDDGARNDASPATRMSESGQTKRLNSRSDEVTDASDASTIFLLRADDNIQQRTRRLKAYSNMNQHRTVVKYNALGDVVHSKVKITQGIPGGTLSQCKSLWSTSRDQSRVFSGLNITSCTEYPETILRQLPEGIRDCIFKDVELPLLWSPQNEHWFDVRRAVRIARTILDVRASKQRAFTLSSQGSNISALSSVESLPRLLVTYFERQYGSGGLNVSQQKVVNFLEALLQYSDVPVLNIFRSFVCPHPVDVLYPNPNLMLCLYIEARAYFYSKNLVIPGDVMKTSSSDGTTVGGDDNGRSVAWQLVKRSDALGCVDEFLRCRGYFGPLCVQRLLLVVDGLPPCSWESSDNNVSASDLIDLETFLEAFVVEFSAVLIDVDNLVVDVFGEMPQASKGLQLLKDLIQRFVEKDHLRTGKISTLDFNRIVRSFLGSEIAPVHVGDHNVFIDSCQENFCCGAVGDQISYVDLWATVLSYFAQNETDHEKISEFAAVIAAVRTVKRGVEEPHAAAILALLGYMSSIPHVREDPSWTFPGIVNSTLQEHSEIGQQQKSLSNSVVGEWSLSHVSSYRIDDADPLLLCAKAATVRERSHTKRNVYEASPERIDAVTGPLVLQSSREVTNEFGEVTRAPDGFIGRVGPQPLSQTVLKLDEPRIDCDSNSLKLSFSRSVSSIKLLKPQLADSTTLVRLTDSATPRQSSSDPHIYAATNVIKSVDVMFKFEKNNQQDGSRSSTAGASSLECGYSHDADGPLSPSLANDSRATDEALRLRRIQVEREKCLILRMAEEEQRMRLLRDKKKRCMFREKKEKYAKEKESLKFKAAADEKRDQARERALRLEEEKRAREEEEERKRQNDLKASRDAERARIAAMNSLKAQKEKDAENRRREGEENRAMYKEDLHSQNHRRMLLRIEEEAALKARREEQERLQKQMRQRLEAEQARERSEISLMCANDVRYDFKDAFEILDVEGESSGDGDDVPVLSHVSSAESAETGVEQEEDMSYSDDEDVNTTSDSYGIPSKSAFQKRVQLLVDNVRCGIDDHWNHDRKAGGGAFFPFSFSNDIVWDPFQLALPVGVVSDETNADDDDCYGGVHELDDAGGPAAGDFSDIGRVVRRRRNQIEKDRIRQLYKTAEVSPSKWTKIVAKTTVDWTLFFDEENKSRHLLDRVSGVPSGAEEQQWISDRLRHMHQVKAQQPCSQHTAHQTDSEISVEFTPLPFTKVYRGVVEIETPNYFQILTTVPHCLVTVELSCKKGFADLYAGLDSIPSRTSYFEKGITNEENGRVARMVLTIEEPRVIMIAVLSSSTGSEYELWACQSGQSAVLPSALDRASRLAQAFNVLSENKVEDLNLHLPKLLSDAHKSVASTIQKSEVRRDSVLRRLSRSFEDFKKASDSELMADLENFVAKRGRSIIKQKNCKDGKILFEDPNSHGDIFPPYSKTQNAETYNQEQNYTNNLVRSDISSLPALEFNLPYQSKEVRRTATKYSSVNSFPIVPITYKVRKIA